jgi:hypothetical protein
MFQRRTDLRPDPIRASDYGGVATVVRPERHSRLMDGFI